MATHRRISLLEHRESIRGWVEEGRNDRWIAGALGTTASSVQSFRSRHGIYRREPVLRAPGNPRAAVLRDLPAYEGVVEQGRDRSVGAPPSAPRVGIWMDPSVADNPVYQASWRGVRRVDVLVSGSRIALVRADRLTNRAKHGCHYDERNPRVPVTSV